MDDLSKKHRSVLRNPAIAEMLYFAKYVEKWGSGIETMNTLIENAGLPKPIYEEIGSSFVVTFKKTETKEHGGLKSLYLIVSQNPGKQVKELSDLLPRPIDTLDKQIRRLVKQKLIERRGSKKTGGYWIIARNDSL